MTRQILEIAGIRRELQSSASEPTYLAGRRIYAIGSLGGGIIPVGAEHLVGQMGGIWAHPFRVLAGWRLSITADDELLALDQADQCTVSFSQLERRWTAPLLITWTEWVADQQPVAYVRLELSNPTAQAWRGRLSFEADFDLRSCWFGGVEVGPTRLRSANGVIQASPGSWADGWGAALGTTPPPHSSTLDNQRASLSFELDLEPGAQVSIQVALVAEQSAGAAVAAQMMPDILRLAAEGLQQRQASHADLCTTGVTLSCPDQAINEAWMLAKLNLRALEAAYPPALPPYFLAGIPEYPQFFGCDTAYSVAGAMAAGFRATTLSAINGLAEVAWRQCGRVPHELTTNGRVFNPGNVQETPQFVLAVWEAVRWTGDRELLERLYPLCREGIREYVVAGHRWTGTPYLWGDGMVERHGMGTFKLDVQCYAIRALQVLAEMAAALDRPGEASDHRAAAASMAAAWNAEWWLDDQHLYADSRHANGANQFDGHWTVILPAQLGIAPAERCAQVLERVLADWVNQWGLVHTREREDRVWTLPTGLLALAAFQGQRPEQGLQLLRNIASTANYGLLGAYKELIPEGLCYVQLWSAALLIEGLVAGLLGIQPNALQHTLSLNPQLPEDWNAVELHGLQLGAQILDLRLSNRATSVTHVRGEQPVTLIWRPGDQQVVIIVAPGAQVLLGANPQEASHE